MDSLMGGTDTNMRVDTGKVDITLTPTKLTSRGDIETLSGFKEAQLTPAGPAGTDDSAGNQHQHFSWHTG